MLRYYEIKRLNAVNVHRSLEGAAARAENSTVWVWLTTKGVVLPEKYDAHAIPGGGCYFEGVYESVDFIENRLNVVVYNRFSGRFDTEIGIRLAEVFAPLGVSYTARQPINKKGRCCNTGLVTLTDQKGK